MMEKSGKIGRVSLRYKGSYRLAAATVSAGLAIGVAAWLLKLMVREISKFVTSGFVIDSGNLWLLVSPVVGIVIVGWIVRHVVKMPLEHSTGLMKKDLADGKGDMPRRLTVASMITSAITLGFGGSAGSEGPIAYTGAAVGSNLARMLRLEDRFHLIFLACGAGAGIAAIFKAPIGGMFFTLEVLRMQLGVLPVLVLAAMCLISGLTAYVLSGCTLNMSIEGLMQFDYEMLPALLLLGCLSGAYSVYYLVIGHKVRSRLSAMNDSLWRNVVSGLMVGVTLFLFPALFGEGYGVLSEVANGKLADTTNGSVFVLFHGRYLLPLTLAGILALKSVATYATNSGGGVAGDFAPTLFAGGIAGALLYVLVSDFSFFAMMTENVMVVCGMAAVMAGVIRAPLMTIFLVVEMTASQQLLLPVAIVVAISLGVSKLLLPDSDRRVTTSSEMHD
ncbi:MAG: chloride channel protein [Muribaculum sp.]|nr:chloride channel protein [Muribaculaceae bacterium]MCM1080254.1 chloride channel protein [Muribaculum sp.]